VEFTQQRVGIWRGTVDHPVHEMHLAMMGEGTELAYLPALEGTLIQKRYPDAFVVVNTATGNYITSFPLPADEETCQKLIEYLSTVEHNYHTRHELIKAFAVHTGQWVWKSAFSSASK
jgi:hypothetical protein